jgi:hypothetical protein
VISTLFREYSRETSCVEYLPINYRKKNLTLELLSYTFTQAFLSYKDSTLAAYSDGAKVGVLYGKMKV